MFLVMLYCGNKRIIMANRGMMEEEEEEERERTAGVFTELNIHYQFDWDPQHQPIGTVNK